ncbi:MAG: hypothetical protein ABJA49_01035 [Betaproteobacteria bacterium]
MIAATVTLCAGRWRDAGPLLIAALLALLTGGCALVPTAAPTAGAATLAPCRAWFQALDTQTEQANVRDAGAAPVAGHPYLRVDRFTASLRDRLNAQQAADRAQAAHDAWIVRLLELDRQARLLELANLPPSALRGLATDFKLLDQAAMTATTRECGERLARSDLATPQQTAQLRENMVVPDDYVDAYRLLGLYPLTRIPFLAGVRTFEAQVRRTFMVGAAPAPGVQRLRLAPPGGPLPGEAARRVKLRVATDNPLGIPMPTPEQAAQLFARHAPVFELGVASADDRPGALSWNLPAGRASVSAPSVDTDQPVVYRQLAYTRLGEASLLQLVYTLWFGARTATTAPVDLLAGRIDGLVWRVTLSPDGEPLVYDSIHPCGCYHMFFPPPGVTVRAAPPAQGEWAFSPAGAAALAQGQRLVLRVAPRTHYLEGLDVQDASAVPSADVVYQWRDYDELRSLPTPSGQRRSVFGPDGIMPGTERLESWLFWPMGIARAGAMRQWGRQATAFVGRRHFDDARLIEARFDLGAVLPGD